MCETVSEGDLRVSVECRGFEKALYLRCHGDFFHATRAQVRKLSRKIAGLIAQSGAGATLLDARFVQGVGEDAGHAGILAQECAKRLGHHHRLGWLAPATPEVLTFCRLAAARLNQTGRVRSAAFCKWDQTMAYLGEPGLTDPARFHRVGAGYPDRGTSTLVSSRISGVQTSRSTMITPDRPQV